MNPFTKEHAITIAGVLRNAREQVRRGEVGVAVIDYAIEKGLSDMLDLHSYGFDRAGFSSRIHGAHESWGPEPVDSRELEAATEALNNAEVTPLGLWLVNAFEIIKPILRDSDTTGKFFGVEKEAMPNILQSVQEMVEHLRNMPRQCGCNSSDCPAWAKGTN